MRSVFLFEMQCQKCIPNSTANGTKDVKQLRTLKKSKATKEAERMKAYFMKLGATRHNAAEKSDRVASRAHFCDMAAIFEEVQQSH